MTLSGFVRLAGVIAAALAVAAAANADNRFSPGFKGGLTIANQSYSYADPSIRFGADWRLGLAAGLSVERACYSFLSVRMEILYVEKGFKQSFLRTDEFGNILGTLHLNARLNDLALNLLAKASTRSCSYILVGPRLDIRLSSSNDFINSYFDEIESKYAETVFGLTFGLGQELRITPRAIVFFEGQYHVDIGKLYDYTARGYDKITTLEIIRNKAFALFAGVRF
jgi:hypothetical protein